MSLVGARSPGSPSSLDPERTTVTRRAANVSRASGVTWPLAESSTVAPISSVRASASVMMSNLFMVHCLPPEGGSDNLTFIIQHRDIRHIAKLLGKVEAVADNEMIFDRESNVFNRHVDLSPRRLAQQTGGAKRLRRPCPQNLLQIRQRQAGIDDVLDDDDVTAL